MSLASRLASRTGLLSHGALCPCGACQSAFGGAVLVAGSAVAVGAGAGAGSLRTPADRDADRAIARSGAADGLSAEAQTSLLATLAARYGATVARSLDESCLARIAGLPAATRMRVVSVLDAAAAHGRPQ